MFPQDSEDVYEVAHVLGYYFALYNHIINIDFSAPIQLWFEHFSHHPLISRPCVFQPNLVVIVSNKSNKNCLFLIVQCQWYVMISLKGIQETHLMIAYRCIYQLIYSRHKERVFRTSLIEVFEVHTHTPFPSFLFHHHRIS